MSSAPSPPHRSISIVVLDGSEWIEFCLRAVSLTYSIDFLHFKRKLNTCKFNFSKYPDIPMFRRIACLGHQLRSFSGRRTLSLVNISIEVVVKLRYRDKDLKDDVYWPEKNPELIQFYCISKFEAILNDFWQKHHLGQTFSAHKAHSIASKRFW